MAMLAGMTKVVPDWQLDRAYETETAEKLEQVYAASDLPIDFIESQFAEARRHIRQAVGFLIVAADKADKYGLAQPIDDLITKLDDDYDDELRKTLKKLKEGA